MAIESSIQAYLRSGKHSETLLINQLSQSRSDNNQQVFKFGFGQSPFPVPDEIVQSLADAAHRKEYMSVQGYLPLRQAIVNFHKDIENKNWGAEQIIVGGGSKILLFCIMAAFKKAEILLPAPSWVSYEPQGKLAGHKVSWLSTNVEDRWRLTAKQLNKFCENRVDTATPLILILNYPSNPTGQTYDANELQALAEVMRKYNLIVIADEIYSLLSYQKKHPSLDHYYPEGCIVSSGISKWCGAGGWRLGFIHIPSQFGDKFFQSVIGVASETYSCASSPVQIAATNAYTNQALAKQYLQKQISLLSDVSEYCTTALKQSSVEVHRAEGGFYLFPDFRYFREKLALRSIFTSEQLTAALMEETGVALLPGSAFGMPEQSLTVRLAFVDFDGSQIWEDRESIKGFQKVEEGIMRICNWLQAL